MILTSGTPLVSTLGKHVVNADISGGTLTIQNAAAQPATYFVDGTLHLSGTGTLDITTGTLGANILAAGRVTMDGGSMTGGGTLNVSGAPRPALPAGPAMTQSGGDIDGLTINTPDYTMSGGTLDASAVNFANAFTLTGSGEVKSTVALNGGAGSTMSQSGGQMDGVATGLDTYTQSGGDLGGSVTTGTYAYTDAAATSEAGATINASQSFLLTPASGAGVVTANLTGSGSLVKSGDGAVALAGTNDFTGTVTINAGTLELRGGNALADGSAVSLANVAGAGLLVTDSESIGSLSGGGTTGGNLDIADGATLTIAGTGGTAFAGNIDGNTTGALVKAGTGALTLSGALSLNALTVDGGIVRITTAGSLGAVTIGDVAGATLAMNQSETIASLSGGGANGGSVTITNGKFLTVGDSTSTTYLGSLSGNATGKFIKQGSGTLTLGGTVAMNTVAVNAGTLELSGAATLGAVTVANTPGATLLLSQSETIASLLGGGADGGTVTIADGKTLTVGDATSTTFLGTMGGETGDLVKQGAGTLTLGGAVTLGDLAVTGGTLQIGTGTSTETASFDSADISAGATVYIAANATLTIREPNNIVNNGYLTNDGTVNDDLANASTFDNNHAYNADVASNTGTINNNTPGVWTGDVLTNAATINNNAGAEWDGDVKGNMGLIRNLAGATWSGHVLATGRHLTAGEIDNYGTWTDGTVEGNSTVIFNYDGSWTGDILGNIYLIVNNINDATANPAGVNAAQWTGTIKGNSRGGVIINDVGGVWTGGITGNMGEIHNRGTWDDGTISGNGSYLAQLLQLSNGYIVNEATGTWNGDIDDNYGSIGNLGGTWNGNVLGNSGGTISNDNAPDETGTGYWIGDIEGNVGGILNGGGGDWTGKVLANSGYIRNDILGVWHGNVTGNINTIENMGIWHGDVVAPGSIDDSTGNAGTIENTGSAALWDGDVDGNAKWIDNRGGTWDGDVLANTGVIYNRASVWDDGNNTPTGPSTWTGDVLSNTGTIDTYDTWNGSFTSAGTVNAMGTIAGAFANSGTLHLVGALGGITTLTNDGILDMRGSSAGQTLTATSATFGAGSTYDVSVDSAGHADDLIADDATLAGHVFVSAKAPPSGSYDYMTPYTIVSAGSIAGAFDGVSTDLAFLDPRLDQTSDAVVLKLVRNDMGFAQAGVTAAQKSVADAAQSLGAGNPIYDSILWLSAGQAQQAFDTLSDAGRASSGSAALETSYLIANAATGRIDQAFDALGGGDASVSNYAAAPAVAADPTLDSGMWGQFYGAHASIAATGTTAGVDTTTGGLAGGIDGLFDQWRLGLLLQSGATGTAMAGLDTSSTSLDYGLGLYGGREWGDTRLAVGAAYTRHDITSARDVAFPGFAETLDSSYSANTAQAFAKLSHRFDLGALSLTPFGEASYVMQATDGYSETGGAAALTTAPNLIDATFTTLGLGAGRKFAVGDDMLLTATGSLGWQHAFTTTPDVTARFAGGADFTVSGTPVVSDMFVLNAGLNLDVSAAATLDLTYDGRLGPGTQTHALEATWNGRF